jgi:cobalt-zinc-cadmium efflux system outer membrane protein
LGLNRAHAEVNLARANVWSDVYWLIQPYTLQDNSDMGLKSPHSWAMGITVPLPVSNRNQGTIRRAHANVEQTRLELAALERDVVGEVQQAEQDVRVSHLAVDQIERELLPAARQVLDSARLNFEKGETDAVGFILARQEANGVVRQYRDALVRNRRNQLRLNTVVGSRILP